jgi:GNAT superfamily N-acetyltransferase
MPARRSERPPASPNSVKRQRAGTYATADGRFTVEASSSGWLLFDAEQTDELGLPLARGPFPTLDGAKAAIEPARSAPAPASGLADRTPRAAAKSPSTARTQSTTPAPKPTPEPAKVAKAAKVVKAARPQRPAVVVREIRTVDGDALRALWADCGFTSLGDDDRSLARLARRNPGLVLVAAEGTRVVGSALGAWDGRRGWIYHVATARTHRRQGIARRLIAEIESGLRALGCPKVNVMVRHENDDGAVFWHALGYGPGTARQLAKELDAG